jgi:glycosyltransferase involved in cell wall biosynthesis
LDRLLASIKTQTFQEFEVIVVDDNSPNHDEYLPVIEKYKNLFSEFSFFINETNRGAPYSRNRGILASKYDLVALVDDDDEWLPEKLEMQVEIFEVSPENVGLVYTWTDAVDENGQVVYRYRSELEGNVKKEILRECFIPSPSVMVRKKAILEAGLFDESFPSCQDWDMWTNIILRGFEVKVAKKVLTLYHKHNAGNIGLSDHAKRGYLLFYKKYLIASIRNGRFNNVKKLFWSMI